MTLAMAVSIGWGPFLLEGAAPSGSPSGERLRGSLSEMVVTGLVIGTHRPGSFFGYDRDPRMGPEIIRWIILALRRDTGYLTWDDVDRLDWEDRVVHLRVNELREMPER